ncbi:MAG: S-layer homology domain-containing protein, partial [Agathobaculum butyriciproducens]|nr:S-layer homology domain-containing protein [Agathobaculum butyriciproducens]
PAGKVTVKAVFMDDNTMLNFFTDVHAEDYYYDAVLWAAQKGITGGMSDTLFAPNAACTRAQIVTFLWRAAGSPEPSALSDFADVPSDKYYAKAVAWAVENGITNGTTDTTFGPDDICTRAHGVTFLYRAAKVTASVGASAFTDVADSAYYADAVKWATEQGITNGISSSLFGPHNNCTRAHIVTFLYRMYGSK